MSRRKACFALASVLSVVPTLVCADTDPPAARAVISGREGLASEFHQNLAATLKVLLGTTDSIDTLLACDILDRDHLSPAPMKEGCSELVAGGNSQVRVQYTFLRDLSYLQAFVLAWERIQRANVDALALTLDTKFPGQECPATCVTNYACAGPPRRCDGKAGPPCNPCPLP